jgi:hypothetical protein
MIFAVLLRRFPPLSENFELPEVARDSRQAKKAASAEVLSTTMVFSISAGAVQLILTSCAAIMGGGSDSALHRALIAC